MQILHLRIVGRAGAEDRYAGGRDGQRRDRAGGLVDLERAGRARGVRDRAVAERAGDPEGVPVEVDGRAGFEAEVAARRPVGVGVERDRPLNVGLARHVVAPDEIGRGVVQLLRRKQGSRHLVVHVSDAVLAHGNEVHDDCGSFRELRGVDAPPVPSRRVGAALFAMPEDVDRVQRAGVGPLRRDRKVELARGGAAIRHGGTIDAGNPEGAFVEMVVADVVHRVGDHVGAHGGGGVFHSTEIISAR